MTSHATYDYIEREDDESEPRTRDFAAELRKFAAKAQRNKHGHLALLEAAAAIELMTEQLADIREMTLAQISTAKRERTHPIVNARWLFTVLNRTTPRTSRTPRV